ncbi:aldo/keto reductase [Gymnopus androsaceus JB14]|uniref:Aldo/keto reductase n=1 Tax=Gymnopus androsaceus JB14 TaxID=1447944 RepID=A0A6A4H2Q9_9AGAR|nr:aldo/keto reductase [Gymnopus androsaceus JB14]
MVSRTVKLGGTASDITVAPVAHGLMAMTWTPNPPDEEQCFASIKAGVDALPSGTKAFLNSGEFYAMDHGTGNLELLSRFYAKYPEYADKTFLSVKGGIRNMAPDGSIECLRASVDNIQRALGPNKKLDLFEPARIDRKTPIETIMNNLVTLLKEGKFSHIGLSECNANTLRKAHAVYPVTAAEIEVSFWSYDDNQQALISTARELNVSVLAYSPLGRGYFTGAFKSPNDLPAGDPRSRFTRFKEENFKANYAIVEGVSAIAEKKGVTPSQLCIAWVSSLGPHMIPLPGSSKASRTLENLQGGDIVLTPEESKAINDILAANPVAGDRYFGADVDVHLWG